MSELKFDPIPEIESKGSPIDEDGKPKKVLSVFEQFAQVDEKAEEEGVWTDSIGEGMRLKIRAFSSITVTQVQTRVLNALRDKMDTEGNLNAEGALELSSRVVAQGMVTGWEGPAFVTPEGEPIEYSPEACYHLARRSKSFRLAVYAFAMNDENYKVQVKADAVKN